jgi:hypothetical protein
MVNCTYCNILFIPKKYNVCEKCREEIVLPTQKNRNKRQKTLFQIYKKEVWRLTEINAKKLEGIGERGWINKHIDHKYSIYQGFKDGKSVDEIASLANLRMLNYKENMAKGIKCI